MTEPIPCIQPRIRGADDGRTFGKQNMKPLFYALAAAIIIPLSLRGEDFAVQLKAMSPSALAACRTLPSLRLEKNRGTK